nr:MAG TPA: hypothetical protein [Caudoviricetes sp.]
MNKELIELINNNSDLPIFAWVDGKVCEESWGYWLGQFGNATIREYAKVESYGSGMYGMVYVFKDEPEDFIEYLLTRNEDMTDKEAERYVQRLNYKKAIFVYVNTPSNF